MSFQPLKKVQRGQPLQIPATDYNSIIDMVNRGRAQGLSGGAGSRLLSGDDSALVVYVKNNSGGAVPRFGILGIDEPLILPEDNETEFKLRVAFSGVAPRIASSSEYGHEGRLLITLEPIADGKIGRAVVSGAIHVQLDIQDEEDHFAEIIDNDVTQLRTNDTSGIPILWLQTGSSSGWGIVLLGGGTGASGGSSSTTSLIYIAGNRTMGGAYKGYIIDVRGFGFGLYNETIDSSGASFTADDILADIEAITTDMTTAEEVTVLNMDETGLTTHALTETTQIKYIVIGRETPMTDDNADDCRVFIIGDSDNEECEEA